LARWRFDSSTHARGGVANGGARCGDAGQRCKAATWLGQRKETTQGDGPNGPVRPYGPVGNWTGEGFRAKIKDLNIWASDLIFKLILRILSSKSKVSNISNWILN
jgi:hypothetical protein